MNIDEAVGTMLPQVGLDGLPLTKEDYIKDLNDGIDNTYEESESIDYISSETQFILSEINKMKTKLYACRQLPFTLDNYRKEFDITRNLIGLRRKLLAVLKTSSDETKRAIDEINRLKSIERAKDISKLDFIIDSQDIKMYGLSIKTLIEASVLHNNDADFVLNDLNKKLKVFNRSFDISFLSTEELETKYPNIKNKIGAHVEAFNHLLNMTSKSDKEELVLSFDAGDVILLAGCKLLSYIPADTKNILSVYRNTVIGEYERILEIVERENPYKKDISVVCCRCPIKGDFYIYLILRDKFYKSDEEDTTTPYDEPAIIEKSEDMPSELKQADVLRGEVEELRKNLDLATEQYKKTGDKKFSNRIEGLSNKLKKKESELDKLEKDLDDYNKSITEAADMEDEIKPIVEKLNEKGYKVRYASPGHHIKKKEDNNKDGKYYGKLYSDARIMFDDKYPFEDAPEYWHLRLVDKCSYLDITPEDTDSKSEDELTKDFHNWKQKYMNSLEKWVDELPENGKVSKSEKEDIVSEALSDGMDIDYCYNLMVESMEDIF